MTERRIILPYPTDDHDHHEDMNNLGFQADMNMLGRSVTDRRKVLAMGLAGIGLLMVGCDTSAGGSTTTDTTAPSVSLTSSATNLSAAGTITLTATASDNVGVASVKFYRGSTLIGTKTSSPYTVTDSITASGTYSYTAVATDAAGLSTTSSTVSVVAAISGTATCAAQPTETAGPYPADGSNSNTNGATQNVRIKTGVNRQDIRTSLGTGNTVAGIPLTLNLKLVNVNASCAALSGYAVYLWHCTPSGEYSMYSSSIISEDYLRGIQASGSDGTLSFTTIFPGCYSGRWPHIHFEVFPSLSAATSSGIANSTLTSQIALPQANCAAVYADSRYGNSASNLNSISLSSDNVFKDGYSTQMATVTGSNTAGYTASITIGLSV